MSSTKYNVTTFCKFTALEHVVYFNDRGHYHKEDGPAIEWIDGTKEWYNDGKLHRKDGPAIERVHSHNEYWLFGEKYSEKKYWSIVNLGSFI